jgi:putative nucleotidyltransferase with HDIG domain
MASNGVGLIWSGLHAELIYRQLAGKALPRFHRLMNPQHPLLMRMEREAQGTYHHSIIVGSLAAHAAYRINGNADLARVLGYYHDIGKLENPQIYLEYFTGKRDHVKAIDNPDDLVAILNHPHASRQLLMRAGFPSEICDHVAEHHGTIRTRLSIGKELLEQSSSEVLHYRGPLPSSRESAIVMLADSCQAMFERKSSLENWPDHPEREFIRNFVEKVGIDLRLAGQFKMSGLSEDAQKKVEGCLMWWLFRFYNNLDTTGTPNGLDVRRVSKPPKNSI